MLANLFSAFSSLLKSVALLREPESSSSESEFHLPWSDVEKRGKRREEMENVSSEIYAKLNTRGGFSKARI